MKTRVVVHIALNAKGERVGKLFCLDGRLVPFSDENAPSKDLKWILRGISEFHTSPSLKKWKDYCKRVERAVRFQRVILLGETK